MTKKRKPNKPSAIHKGVESRKKSGLLSLFWMVIGVCIAVAIAMIIYYSPLFDGFRQEVAIEPETPVKPINQPAPAQQEYAFYDALPKQDFKSVPLGVSVQESTKQAQVVQADVVVKAPEPSQETVGDLGVDDAIDVVEEDATYDGADAKPKRTSSEKSAKQATQDGQNITYILQVRSYTNATEADEKRTQVMMAGVDATVVRRVDKQSGKTFYQVVSLPMHSREQASEALFALKNSGIDALLVEQRR